MRHLAKLPESADGSPCSGWQIQCLWIDSPDSRRKTPTNMLISRLLQAMFTRRSSPSPESHVAFHLPVRVKFIFISRHPLAVSLALRRWQECERMSVGSLVAHWLASHRTLASDLPHLRSVRVLRFEDLARAPFECLGELLEWLELPKNLDPQSFAHVSSSTNKKYEDEYCKKHLASTEQRQNHCKVANVLQPTMSKLNLGYDIRYGNELGFGCMATALGDEREDCETISGGVLDDLLHLLPPVEGMPSKDGLTLPLDPSDALSMGKLQCAGL